MTWRLTIPKWEGEVDAEAKVDTQATLEVEARTMTWRLTISWWEGRVTAKATAKMKAKLKVEAKGTDLATGNPLVGAQGEGKGKGEDTGDAKSGSKGARQ